MLQRALDVKENRMLGCVFDTVGSRQNPVAGRCERGNKSLGSVKDEVFLDQMSDSQLLKKTLLHEVIFSGFCV
jgi:hypothetical protein